MPSYSDNYLAKKQVADCIELFKKLADARLIRVGQIYDWPGRFDSGFTSGDLNTVLNYYMNAAGFQYTITGDQLSITGIYP